MPAPKDLVFYDILCKQGEMSWSPNTLKVEYALKYMNIPFKKEFISYPDIAAHHQKLGIQANNPDAVKFEYSCPAISYTLNGRKHAVQDSNLIMQVIEKEGWGEKDVRPQGARAFEAIVGQWMGSLFPALRSLMFPAMPDFLDERGGKYFYDTRTKMFGPLESMSTPADVEASRKTIESIFKQVAAVLSAEKGAFLMGEQPIYADFILVSVLHWLKQVRPDAFEKVLGTAPEVKRFWEACEQWR